MFRGYLFGYGCVCSFCCFRIDWLGLFCVEFDNGGFWCLLNDSARILILIVVCTLTHLGVMPCGLIVFAYVGLVGVYVVYVR